MDTPQRILVDPLSARSLLLELTVNGHPLGTATGFVVQNEGRPFLITNWHVVSGRNADTGQVVSDTAGIPDEVRIVHHATQRLGSWVIASEKLYTDVGEPRWIEHPQGQRIDVVALPLNPSPEVAIYPFDLTLANTDIISRPAMPVSIIGYPFGLATAGAWPIWKTGHIASDPDLDYDGRPAFLIDATTRGGMSGSPVVLRLTGGYSTRDGSYVFGSGVVTKFLGVYSGRIHGQSEIGRVWRPHVVNEIFQR